MRRDHSFAPTSLIFAAVWFFFTAIYLLLRSNQYTAVDGALNCLWVYRHGAPYLGGNNHLLWGGEVYAWSRLMALLGIVASDPVSFLHETQIMNAVCAGGSVALVGLIVWRLTESLKVSLTCSILYGFSRALLAHGTNSSQPVVGVFVSLVAAWLVVEGLIRNRARLLFMGGVCLAFALASYESMLLDGPVLILLCVIYPTQVIGDGSLPPAHRERLAMARSSRLSLRRLASCASGTFIGIAAIYGAAYYISGITGPRQMIRAFFRLGGGHKTFGFGGVSLAKIANAPVGLIGSMASVVPTNYHGLRWLSANFHQHVGSVIGIAGTGVLLALTAGSLAFSIVRRLTSRREAVVALLILGALSFELFPVLYWAPLYLKLWLQPLALGLITAGVLAVWTRPSERRWLAVAALALLAVELAANLPAAALAHTEPTNCLADAQRVETLVKPSDKVVTDFDPVSQLWMALYDRYPARNMLFPATPSGISLSTLKRWTEECADSDCRIIFIGVLGQSRHTWNAFLGSHVKVPYDALNRYREGSRDICRLACEGGSVWLYQPAAVPRSDQRRIGRQP